MFEFLESPEFIFIFIVSASTILLVSFLSMVPRAKRENQTIETPVRAAEGNRFECTVLGFARSLPEGEPLPDECMSCPKLLECMVAKDAFDWYVGQKTAQAQAPQQS
jgi:hypothetical protein